MTQYGINREGYGLIIFKEVSLMTKAEMLNFLKSTFPNLEIKEVQANTNGWDNDILIVNKEIVFRFPKSADLLSKVLNERKILELLKLKEPALDIPEYEYVYSGSMLKGVKYSFLNGQSLSEYPIKNLRDNPENAKLIGEFLTKLHSINISDLNKTTLETLHTLQYWEELYNSVTNTIFPFLNDKQRKEINEVFTNFIELFPYLNYRKTIIHGDLTASNIIFDKRKKCVSAIIDFTDAQIGDAAFDFAGLYWSFGPEFTEDVLSWYRSPETASAIYKRVKNFYGLQPVFHELLFAVKNKQDINWDVAFKKFSYLHTLNI